MDNLPADFFVTSSAYTPHVYRDQYPSIDPKSPALSQEGKVIIITGASDGIGARGFAPQFARAKPKAIVLVGRNADKLRAVEDSLKKLSSEVECVSVPTDIASEASVASLFDVIEQKYGHADVLVNNAGMFQSTANIADADPAKWWLDFEVNVKGLFLVTRGFLKLLGTESPGYVVNLSTGIATFVQGSLSSYSISKTANLQFTAYVAAEYPNVSAVAVQPGVVDTDMVIGESCLRFCVNTADNIGPYKRFAHDTPELIGGTGVWLATEAARFLSGRFISANWSVDDLMARKEEIAGGKELTMQYQGKFGLDQFKN